MKKLYSLYLMIILLMILTYLFFKPFYSQEGWPPYASEIVAAILGALFTTLITSLLLEKQSAAEERKEKNIGIYNKKYEVYSRFFAEFNEIIKDKKPIGPHDRRKIVKCACEIFLVATTRNAIRSLYKFVYFLNNNDVLYEDEMTEAEMVEWAIKYIKEFGNEEYRIDVDDIDSVSNNIKKIVPSIGTVMCSLRLDLASTEHDEINAKNANDKDLLEKIDDLIV